MANVATVENNHVAEEANAKVEPDGTENIVELTSEAYEQVLRTAQRAHERGMDDSFGKWLAKLIETGFRTVNRVWDTADANTRNKAVSVLIAAALDGSKTAIEGLHKMGLEVAAKKV